MKPQPRSSRIHRALGGARRILELFIFVAVLIGMSAASIVLLRPSSAPTGSNSAVTAAPPELELTPTSIAATDVVSPNTELLPTPVPVHTIVVTPLPPMNITEDDLRATEIANLPPEPPMPTFGPTDPVNVLITNEAVPDTAISMEESPIVVIGTVRQVLPARWTTSGGGRPARVRDPHLTAGIFRPVLLEVEQYLKGQRPQQQLMLFAVGGQIGQDSFVIEPDYLYSFQEGERVVLFLKPYQGPVDKAQAHRPFYYPMERYTITPEGHAENYYRTVPLEELLTEIRDAQGS